MENITIRLLPRVLDLIKIRLLCTDNIVSKDTIRSEIVRILNGNDLSMYTDILAGREAVFDTSAAYVITTYNIILSKQNCDILVPAMDSYPDKKDKLINELLYRILMKNEYLRDCELRGETYASYRESYESIASNEG